MGNVNFFYFLDTNLLTIKKEQGVAAAKHSRLSHLLLAIFN